MGGERIREREVGVQGLVGGQRETEQRVKGKGKGEAGKPESDSEYYNAIGWHLAYPWLRSSFPGSW